MPQVWTQWFHWRRRRRTTWWMSSLEWVLSACVQLSVNGFFIDCLPVSSHALMICLLSVSNVNRFSMPLPHLVSVQCHPFYQTACWPKHIGVTTSPFMITCRYQSRDWFTICHFLLAVHCNVAFISSQFWDIWPKHPCRHTQTHTASNNIFYPVQCIAFG